MSGDGIRVYSAPGLRGMSFAEILDSRLFLGPAAVPLQEPERLSAAGVTHVLNLTMSERCNDEQFCCKQVKVEDDASQGLRCHFDECFAFIDGALSGGGVVYVHCVAGVSRSATIVVAYLMQRHAMTLRQAFQHVRQRRTCAAPNVGFFEQLCAWEKELHVSRAGSEVGFKQSYPLTEYQVHCLQQVFPDVAEDTVMTILKRCNMNVLQAETMLLDMVVNGDL